MNEALEYLKEHAPEAWADRHVRIALQIACSIYTIAEMRRLSRNIPEYTPEKVIEAENSMLERLKRSPALWYKLKSEDEFYIKDRGKVFYFNNTGIPLKNLKLKDIISINGGFYKIAGIVSYAVDQLSRDMLTTYGILVKEFPY